MLRKFILLAVALITAPSLIAATEYRGMIFKTNLEAGLIQVDTREHRIDVGKTQVFYQDRPVGISSLEQDMFVRYQVNSKNQVEVIWIIGPEQLMRRILNH